jgi:hypothetical protein
LLRLGLDALLREAARDVEFGVTRHKSGT